MHRIVLPGERVSVCTVHLSAREALMNVRKFLVKKCEEVASPPSIWRSLKRFRVDNANISDCAQCKNRSPNKCAHDARGEQDGKHGPRKSKMKSWRHCGTADVLSNIANFRTFIGASSAKRCARITPRWKKILLFCEINVFHWLLSGPMAPERRQERSCNWIEHWMTSTCRKLNLFHVQQTHLASRENSTVLHRHVLSNRPGYTRSYDRSQIYVRFEFLRKCHTVRIPNIAKLLNFTIRWADIKM